MSMQQPFREREREGGQQRPQEDWQQGDQRMSPQGDWQPVQRFPRQDVRQGGQQASPIPVDPEQLATGLGWFSIGLGLAQLAAPRQVAQLIGVNDDGQSQSVLRAVGLREIVSGLGILAQSHRERATWVKARVGGDVMDLALLGRALSTGDHDQTKVATALAAVAGITAIDLFCSQQLSSQEGEQQGQQMQPWQEIQIQEQPFGSRQGNGDQGRLRQGQQQAQTLMVGEEEKGIHVTKAVTINRSPEELYQFWHNFENLPRFMSHVKSVQTLDDRRSHWKVNGPANTSVEWDAEVVDDQPNKRIAWQSLEGASVRNAGWVRFEPVGGNRGTRVTVELQYEPPLGKLGATVAKFLGEEPEKQVYDDLHAFKQVMEIGEVTRSEGSLWGPHLAQRPAQPPSDQELMKHG